MEKVKSIVKQYKWTVVMVILFVVLYFINAETAKSGLKESVSTFTTMLEVLPPILILSGLLDVWVSKEALMKYMGPDSGIKGILVALALGSLAAGPLYVAFPIAAVLMKKNARFAYVLFFLGVWSSSKLPLVIYEFTSFGGQFTIIHIVSNLIIFLIGSFIIERIIGKKSIDEIYLNSEKLTADK